MLPLILEGGYDRWYLSYGPLCIGKWTQKDTSVKNDVKKPVEPDLGIITIHCAWFIGYTVHTCVAL